MLNYSTFCKMILWLQFKIRICHKKIYKTVMDSITMPTVVIKRRKTAFFLPVTHLVRHIKKKRHKIQLTYILVSNGVVRPGKNAGDICTVLFTISISVAVFTFHYNDRMLSATHFPAVFQDLTNHCSKLDNMKKRLFKLVLY